MESLLECQTTNDIKNYFCENPELLNSVMVNFIRDRERTDILDIALSISTSYIDDIDDIGMTPLNSSCLMLNNSCKYFVEKLVYSGADANIGNVWGHTPLHTASTYNNDVNVVLLLIGISNPNKVDNYGNTALITACGRNKNRDIISALIGVSDTSIRNFSGESAYDVALRLNNYSILSLFNEKS